MKKLLKIILIGIAVFIGLGICGHLIYKEDDVSDHPSVSVLIDRTYELRQDHYLVYEHLTPYAYYLSLPGSSSQLPQSEEEYFRNPNSWSRRGVSGLIRAGEQLRINRVLAEHWELMGDVRVICAIIETGEYEGTEVSLIGLCHGVNWDSTLVINQEFLKPLMAGEDEIAVRPPIPHPDKQVGFFLQAVSERLKEVDRQAEESAPEL